MTDSPNQLDIFAEIRDGTSNLLVDAVAGSGKTTTICRGAAYMPPFVYSVFLAFNKRIAEELAKRLPSHVQSSTFHAKGFSALRRYLPKSPKVDGDKTKTLVKSALKWKDFELYGTFICKAISLAKSAGIGTSVLEDTPENWNRLIAHFGLTLESLDADPEVALSHSRRFLQHGNTELSVIDFDDMLYLALLLNVRFDLASFVVVDEAQDTNGVQRALIHKMKAPAGRVIAVGDEKQSIYGFRGADASAMKMLEEEFSMKRLPLSVCYRCSKAVIREVQKFL